MQKATAYAQLRDVMTSTTEDITIFESVDNLEDKNFDNRADSTCIKGG